MYLCICYFFEMKKMGGNENFKIKNKIKCNLIIKIKEVKKI